MIRTTSQDLVEDSLMKDFVVMTNDMLRRIAQSKKWNTEFTMQEKQTVLGLISVIGGWQPSLAAGQLV